VTHGATQGQQFLLRRNVAVAEELVGQPVRTERQGHGELRHPAPSEGHFKGAASDVEDGQRSGSPAHPAPYTEEGELGLHLAGQYAQAYPRPLGHGSQYG
jgi:hypothetical protein